MWEGGGGGAHNKREKALSNLVKQSAYAFCNNQNMLSILH